MVTTNHENNFDKNVAPKYVHTRKYPKYAYLKKLFCSTENIAILCQIIISTLA